MEKKSDIIKQNNITTEYQGKWLTFHKVNTQIKDKMINEYEFVQRTTRLKDIHFDCVDIFAYTLDKINNQKQIILIANYRPPVNQYVLEFPGGIMDDTNILENALRELKEETGYTGQSINQEISPILFCDPWKSKEASKMVQIEINLDLKENKNPKQLLEHDEEIKVHLLTIDGNLCQSLSKLANDNNYGILSSLWCFVLALQFSSQLNQNK